MAVNSFSPLPGPRSFPLLGWRGNALIFGRDPIAFLRRLHHDYGDVAAIAGGVEEFVFFFNPDHTRQIFSDPTRFYNTDIETSTTFRFPEGTAYTRLFSGGLNQMNGPRHRQQRRLMMPSFHKKYIEGYREGMIALTEQKMNSWQPERPLNLLQEMRELTAAIAIRAFFGLDPAQEGAKIRDMLEAWQRLFFSPWSTLAPFNLPGLPLIMQRYRLSLPSKTRIDRQGRVLSAPRKGISINIHPQDAAFSPPQQITGNIHSLVTTNHL